MLFELVVGALFVCGTIALTLAAYFLMRFLLVGDAENAERELANSVIFRISALHGLILALVFAQEMIDYQGLRYETATEANAIADIYFDAGRYGDNRNAPIQKALSDYITVVIDKEWQELGATDRLSQDAWAQWDIATPQFLTWFPRISARKACAAICLTGFISSLIAAQSGRVLWPIP